MQEVVDKRVLNCLNFSIPDLFTALRMTCFVELPKSQMGCEIRFRFGRNKGLQILRNCFISLFKRKKKRSTGVEVIFFFLCLNENSVFKKKK